MARTNAHQHPANHAMPRSGANAPKVTHGGGGDVIKNKVTDEAKAHRAKTLEERSANKGAPTTTYAT